MRMPEELVRVRGGAVLEQVQTPTEIAVEKLLAPIILEAVSRRRPGAPTTGPRRRSRGFLGVRGGNPFFFFFFLGKVVEMRAWFFFKQKKEI